MGTFPHNEYLSYGIAFGLVCGILYLAVPVWLLFSLWRAIGRSTEFARATVTLAGVGALTVLLVNSFTDHLSANRWYFNVVWCVVWYAAATRRAPEPAEPPPAALAP
jgi:O-antigen ligase